MSARLNYETMSYPQSHPKVVVVVEMAAGHLNIRLLLCMLKIKILIERV
jgi:hypothetical protein